MKLERKRGVARPVYVLVVSEERERYEYGCLE